MIGVGEIGYSVDATTSRAEAFGDNNIPGGVERYAQRFDKAGLGLQRPPYESLALDPLSVVHFQHAQIETLAEEGQNGSSVDADLSMA